MTRRSVRCDSSFFEELDLQLGEERGPNGEPSAADFLLVELPLIAEVCATRFEPLIQPIPGRPDYRSHLTTGVLVPRVLVTGHLAKDNAVTLLSIEVGFDADW